MKHDDRVTDALANVSLFGGLDKAALRRIAAQTNTFTFRSGESVIDADSSGRFGRLYVVVSGTAEALIGDDVVAKFGTGDYFGEMSVLDGSPRSASVVATSDLETYGLASWNMRSLLREEPDIALHIIQTLAGRLRAQNLTRYE
ncbi:MAG TPA: cyclic nucleotide-binding domain-containing protein [Ilumatobacteraceae bacterium]|nr:cyclic nucleotide-binding domain-containing protein [Ilumatobacteraceae bacterium]